MEIDIESINKNKYEKSREAFLNNFSNLLNSSSDQLVTLLQDLQNLRESSFSTKKLFNLFPVLIKTLGKNTKFLGNIAYNSSYYKSEFAKFTKGDKKSFFYQILHDPEATRSFTEIVKKFGEILIKIIPQLDKSYMRSFYDSNKIKNSIDQMKLETAKLKMVINRLSDQMIGINDKLTDIEKNKQKIYQNFNDFPDIQQEMLNFSKKMNIAEKNTNLLGKKMQDPQQFLDRGHKISSAYYEWIDKQSGYKKSLTEKLRQTGIKNVDDYVGQLSTLSEQETKEEYNFTEVSNSLQKAYQDAFDHQVNTEKKLESLQQNYELLEKLRSNNIDEKYLSREVRDLMQAVTEAITKSPTNFLFTLKILTQFNLNKFLKSDLYQDLLNNDKSKNLLSNSLLIKATLNSFLGDNAIKAKINSLQENNSAEPKLIAEMSGKINSKILFELSDISSDLTQMLIHIIQHPKFIELNRNIGSILEFSKNKYDSTGKYDWNSLYQRLISSVDTIENLTSIIKNEKVAQDIFNIADKIRDNDLLKKVSSELLTQKILGILDTQQINDQKQFQLEHKHIKILSDYAIDMGFEAMQNSAQIIFDYAKSIDSSVGSAAKLVESARSKNIINFSRLVTKEHAGKIVWVLDQIISNSALSKNLNENTKLNWQLIKEELPDLLSSLAKYSEGEYAALNDAALKILPKVSEFMFITLTRDTKFTESILATTSLANNIEKSKNFNFLENIDFVLRLTTFSQTVIKHPKSSDLIRDLILLAKKISNKENAEFLNQTESLLLLQNITRNMLQIISVPEIENEVKNLGNTIKTNQALRGMISDPIITAIRMIKNTEIESTEAKVTKFVDISLNILGTTLKNTDKLVKAIKFIDYIFQNREYYDLIKPVLFEINRRALSIFNAIKLPTSSNQNDLINLIENNSISSIVDNALPSIAEIALNDFQANNKDNKLLQKLLNSFGFSVDADYLNSIEITQDLSNKIFQLLSKSATYLIPFGVEMVDIVSPQAENIIQENINSNNAISLSRNITQLTSEMSKENKINLALERLRDGLKNDQSIIKLTKDALKTMLSKIRSRLTPYVDNFKFMHDSLGISSKIFNLTFAEGRNLITTIPKLISLDQARSELTELNNIERKTATQEVATNFVDQLNKLVSSENVSQFLHDNLLPYLSNNNIIASKLVSNVIFNRFVSNQLTKKGFDQDLKQVVQSNLNLGMSISKNILPFGLNLLKEITNEEFKGNLVEILSTPKSKTSPIKLLASIITSPFVIPVLEILSNHTAQIQIITQNILSNNSIAVVKNAIRASVIAKRAQGEGDNKKELTEDDQKELKAITKQIMKDSVMIINNEEFTGAAKSLGSFIKQNASLKGIITKLLMERIINQKDVNTQNRLFNEQELKPIVEDLAQITTYAIGSTIENNRKMINVAQGLSSLMYQKDQVKSTATIVHNIMKIIKDKKIRQLIDQVAEGIDKNPEQFNSVMGKFFNQSEIGQKLSQTLLSNNDSKNKSSEIGELAEYYKNRQYAKLTRKVIRLTPKLINIFIQSLLQEVVTDKIKNFKTTVTNHSLLQEVGNIRRTLDNSVNNETEDTKDRKKSSWREKIKNKFNPKAKKSQKNNTLTNI